MREMHFLVIQHPAIEPPGVIGETIRHQGHRLTTVCTAEGEPIPEVLADCDGLIVMGGPQSANDTHLPYIAAELALLAEAVRLDMPVLGICLGAQLLAKAAGGSIAPSPVRELGWYTITGAAAAVDDPLFAELAGVAATVFQWHGESFTLPPGGKLLATDAAVPQQAFRLGKYQYGLQFHLEVDAATIETWIAHGESEQAHLGERGLAAIHAGISQYLAPMRAWCRRLTEQWLILAAEACEKR